MWFPHETVVESRGHVVSIFKCFFCSLKKCFLWRRNYTSCFLWMTVLSSIAFPVLGVSCKRFQLWVHKFIRAAASQYIYMKNHRQMNIAGLYTPLLLKMIHMLHHLVSSVLVSCSVFEISVILPPTGKLTSHPNFFVNLVKFYSKSVKISNNFGPPPGSIKTNFEIENPARVTFAFAWLLMHSVSA